MFMYDAIKNFAKQFSWESIIVENGVLPSNFRKFIVAGMGGSHLAADLLKLREPRLELVIHCDYGLPSLSSQNLKDSLIIVSSYSGNTEETIDAFKSAHKRQLPLIAISTGGQE